ncbi:MAG TPA: trypsin-like peptidase domain-containing protein [Longimicrobiales bacterium]|nr:trypsin-like peptidase domain-containing protein [Longimicrobiales bacterium]
MYFRTCGGRAPTEIRDDVEEDAMMWHGRTGILLLAAIVASAGCTEEPAPALPDMRPATTVEVEPRFVHASLPVDTAMAFALSSAFRAAASHALPAVVRINVVSRVDARGTGQQGTIGETRRTRGAGSGFVIDTLGHIITNHHVIASAERASVVLADGRQYEAEIVASDPNTDIGVVRVDPARIGALTPATLANSDSLRVGDWVLALGNPLDLNFTVTAGIVSAKGRNLNILQTGNRALEAFVQTDAAINPGNSGGPLVDLYGRVVGVNSAIESSTGFFSGAGFAIPMNLAAKVADDLIRFGVVHRPRLGVVIQDVNAADAEVYGLSSVTGAEIASITPGLPAEQAGLRMGDVVIRLNASPIRTVAELQDRVARLQPGDRVTLDIVRFGEAIQTTVELTEFEQADERSVRPATSRTGLGLLGFSVQALSAEEALANGLPEAPIVAITDVDRFGPAFETNLFPPSVLLSINGQPITSLAALEAVADRLQPGQVVSVVVINPTQPEAAPTIFNYRLR